jgi:hypothetical protein
MKSDLDRDMIKAICNKENGDTPVKRLLTKCERWYYTLQKSREVYYDAIATACMRAKWTPHLMPLLGGAWVHISDLRTRQLMKEKLTGGIKNRQKIFTLKRSMPLGNPSKFKGKKWPKLMRVGLIRIFPQAEERLLD